MTQNDKSMVKQFIAGVKYIKSHNGVAYTSDSLDFDSLELNMPDLDFSNLISGLGDNVLPALNLTWQDNDNGGLYILPIGGHVSNGDGLNVDELLDAFKALPVA